MANRCSGYSPLTPARLAFIPASFDKTLPQAFDRTYMNVLFLVGYQMGVAGYPWATQPPGLSRD